MKKKDRGEERKRKRRKKDGEVEEETSDDEQQWKEKKSNNIKSLANSRSRSVAKKEEVGENKGSEEKENTTELEIE